MNARLSSLLVAGGVVLAAVPSGWLSAAAPVKDAVPGPCNLQEVILDHVNGTVLNLVIPGFQNQPVVQVLDKPHRVVVDLPGVDLAAQLSKKQLAQLRQGRIQKARVAKFGLGTRVVLEVPDGTQAGVSTVSEGVRIALEVGNGPVSAHLAGAAPVMAPESVKALPVDLDSAVSVSSHVAESKQESARCLDSQPVATKTPLSPIPAIGMPFQVISHFAVSTLLPTAPGLQDQPAEAPPGVNPVAAEPPAQASRAATALDRNRTLGESQVRYTGSRMTFDVRSMEIQEFLRIVADHAGLNLVVDPDVQGLYGFKFTNTPWDQVLDIMLKHVGLGQEISNGVIRVAKVEKLQKEEEDRKKLEDAKALAGDLQTVSRPLSFAKVGEAKGVVEKMLTRRGSILLDDRTNTLIISDLPRNIALIDDLIAQLDVQIQQVQIEARVVEANKDFQRAFGVLFPATTNGNAKLNVNGKDAAWGAYGAEPSWNSLSATKGGSSNSLATAWSTNTPIADPSGTLWVSFLSNRFSLNAILQAMERDGKVKIVSSPKLVTQNNKKAKILSGRKIPYSTVQGGGAAGAISVSFIDANLELDVTPQITNDGTIIMDIKMDKAEADFGTQVGGTPTILKKSLETQVLVKDGGTAVLGGVYTTKTSDGTTGVPFLSKIPLIGWLFRSNNDKEETTEMLVFVTPRIVKN